MKRAYKMIYKNQNNYIFVASNLLIKL